MAPLKSEYAFIIHDIIAVVTLNFQLKLLVYAPHAILLCNTKTRRFLMRSYYFIISLRMYVKYASGALFTAVLLFRYEKGHLIYVRTQR